MKKKLKKVDLYNAAPLKKPEMKRYRGGRSYLYCTVTFYDSDYVSTGYCGTATTERECCEAIAENLGKIGEVYRCCTCS